MRQRKSEKTTVVRTMDEIERSNQRPNRDIHARDGPRSPCMFPQNVMLARVTPPPSMEFSKTIIELSSSPGERIRYTFIGRYLTYSTIRDSRSVRYNFRRVLNEEIHEHHPPHGSLCSLLDSALFSTREGGDAVDLQTLIQARKKLVAILVILCRSAHRIGRQQSVAWIQQRPSPSPSSRRLALKAEWNSIPTRLEADFRIHVLRYAKLSEEQSRGYQLLLSYHMYQHRKSVFLYCERGGFGCAWVQFSYTF